MGSKEVVNKQFRPSALLDGVLTSIFGALVVWIMYSFYIKDITDLYIFLAGCVFIYMAIKVTDIFCAVVMRDIVSKKLLAHAPFNDPLSNKKTYLKFVGSMWQLVIHVSMTLVELYILHDETWLEMPWTVYSKPWSHDFVPKLSLRIFFLLQMGIWVCTCFSHRFNAEAHMHKDYIPMYIHHLVTIALVTIAYISQHTRVGFIILYVHDFSDIGVDALKICNYLRLEGRSGFFLVETVYATSIAMWGYFRLYLFPVQTIYNGAMRIASPSTTWLAADGTITYASHLAEVFGADSDVYFTCVYGITIGVGLLCILLVLHVYWFLLLLRILTRLLSAAKPHEAGAAEYEGDDHTEKEENVEVDTQDAVRQAVSVIDENKPLRRANVAALKSKKV